VNESVSGNERQEIDDDKGMEKMMAKSLKAAVLLSLFVVAICNVSSARQAAAQAAQSGMPSVAVLQGTATQE
jgi:hypothetical protein